MEMDFFVETSEIIQRREVLTTVKDNVVEIIRHKGPEKLEDIIASLDYQGLKVLVFEELRKKVGDDFGNKFKLMVIEGSGELEETLKIWHEKVAIAAIKAIIRIQEERDQ